MLSRLICALLGHVRDKSLPPIFNAPEHRTHAELARIQQELEAVWEDAVLNHRPLILTDGLGLSWRCRRCGRSVDS